MLEDEARGQLALVGRMAPRCRPGSPILMAYVDNANGYCWDGADSLAFLHALCFVLEGAGIRFRIKANCDAAWDTVGYIFWADLKLITNKPFRLWRLRGAAVELRRQGQRTGPAMRFFLGHAVHAFQLRRCAYSILERVFTFISGAGDHLLHFNEFVDKELRPGPHYYPWEATQVQLPVWMPQKTRQISAVLHLWRHGRARLLPGAGVR